MKDANPPLFDETLDISGTPAHLKRRLVTVCRNQIEMKCACLDELIDDDHIARHIWAYVEKANLTVSLNKIRSIEGGRGRPAIDPKILISVWLYATILGVGSAWILSEYCKDHNGFKWLCGGVTVDRKTLSNFRSDNGEAFDELLINGVAILSHAKIVTLEEIAQDGLKVRASASKHSFHREKTLKTHFEEAKERVKFLKQEIEKDPAACRDRVKRTQMARAQDRVKQLEKALDEYKDYCEAKDNNRKKHRKKALSEDEKAELRVSSTDPDARKMKMADGGFRTAYNVQFAVDTASQVIVGVDVSKGGNDGEEMLPMFHHICKTYGAVPSRYLADGGFKNESAIKTLYEAGCMVYMPSRSSETATKARVSRSKKQECIVDWQARMETEEGKTIYKRRASTVECVNAQVRHKGFYQFVVRGINKVNAYTKLMAAAHNMIRTIAYGLV